MKSYWEELPPEVQATIPEHIAGFLSRCRPGALLRVPRPRWVNYRELRSEFRMLLRMGKSRNAATTITADAHRISERWVRRIVCGSDRD